MKYQKDFAEKFPELKGKTGCIATRECVYVLIEQHCLSKQRVLSAIEKHRNHADACVSQILKELGLEGK